MFKTLLCFVFILVAMGTYNNCNAQYEICTIPKVTLTPTLDGIIDESENNSIWGLVSSRPLRFFVKPEDEWEWSNDWPDVTQGYTKDDIWVYWNAVWNGNEIYFFITMEDDVVDKDHREHKIPNFDGDDSIHLWSEDKESEVPSKDFAKVLNYLFHNDVTDTFFVQQIDGTFDTVYVNDTNSKVKFGKLNNNPTWFVESAITSSDGNSYQLDNSLWFNFTYNDADGKVNPSDPCNNRKLKLAWNGHSYVAPWETPGLLILGPEVTAKQEIVYVEYGERMKNMVNDSQVSLTNNLHSGPDGILDEEEYKHIAPIILTSSRAPQLNDSLWTFWTHPSDAAVIFRSFWNPYSRALCFGFEIFDDYRDSSNVVDSLRNFIQDDGLHIWIDFDRDNRYTLSSDDINILIHNNGNIYQKIDTTSYENFDSPFINQNVQLAIGDLGPPTNWIAEVMINIPPDFFSYNPDSRLHIEIGYNDADNNGYRDHQLVWNNVNYGITPWNNFTNLGYLKLSGEMVYSDDDGPIPSGAPTVSGSYSSNIEVTFNWLAADDQKWGTGISTYHLQVGTVPNGNDLFDKWIGDTLRYVVTGSHGQTLYARVQAQDRTGNIGDWSASSDGITIDVTSPSVPGKPRIVYTNSDSVRFTWSCASDDESGIFDYQLQVITALGDSIYNDWLESNDTTFTLPNPDGLILHARVRAMNGARSIGGWSNWSNGITILPIDIIFAFDLSENMADNMEAMKQAVMTTMKKIRPAGIDACFGVASFVDYPGTHNSCNYSAQYGSANDYPWEIDQELTSDTNLVKAAINELKIYDGEDGPQAYTRALLECLFLNWRPDSRKFVVMIGNAPAHDCGFFSTSYGKDPGPDAQMDTWDDLDYKTVVDCIDRAGLTVIAIDNGTATDSTLDYEGDVWKNFEYLAAKTGGRHFMKSNWKGIPSAIEEIISQGPKSDSLFYPWISEAEQMHNRKPWYGSLCEDGWRLTHHNQPIYSGVVFLTDSLYHFTISAKGEIANEAAPWLLVEIGNGFKGTCEIKNTAWEDCNFVAAIPKGFHCLKLTFLNDWWNQYLGDRNLLLDQVTINYQIGSFDSTYYVFEAEEMSHHSEGSSQVGDYWKLNKRYANIAHTLYFEKQELDCEIFAKADSAAGDWPQMDIFLDGKMVNSFLVDDTSNIGFKFALSNIESGEHRIKIKYNSDHYHRGRNLYIDKLVIYTNDGGLLKSVNGGLAEEEVTVAIPETYDLTQNSPNPFNPDTYIKYQLPEDSHVLIKIFNTLGQEIKTLVNQDKTAGYYSVYWDGLDNNGNQVGSGIYLYQIRAGSFVCTKKMILLK
jgi:hypothetical protein